MEIYCITNIINGKKYIGSNSNDNPKYYGSGTYIKKALKKYGKKNFKKEIINRVNDLQIMKELEEYWIEYFDAYNNPLFYNSTKYSAGLTKFPENKKINISKANKGNKYHLGYKQSEFQKSQTKKANLGKKISEEHKQKISNAVKGNKYALGNKLTDEQKLKISKSKTGHKSYKNPERGKKISKALKGKKRSIETINKLKKQGYSRYKPVIQYDIYGNFIQEFPSVKLAAKFFNKISSSNIIDCCKLRKPTAFGYVWKYKKQLK